MHQLQQYGRLLSLDRAIALEALALLHFEHAAVISSVEQMSRMFPG